jgi:hypothetical protein
VKPVTSQDTKWTRLQTTQGLKHQYVKLRRLGGLPIRCTQPERYSRNPRHHDLSVQIQRHKWPLMEKVWIPKLCVSTIASIWKCGRPDSGQGARRCDSRNTCCADKSETRQIIFWGHFGDLILVSKETNEYQLNTEFALFGVRTWEIWCPQGRVANQENLDDAEFMETKFASPSRKISCKASWSRGLLIYRRLHQRLISNRGHHSHTHVRGPPVPIRWLHSQNAWTCGHPSLAYSVGRKNRIKNI